MSFIIASIIIAGLTQGITAALKNKGAQLSKQGQKLVRDMYNKISKNQTMIEDLQRAYNNKDNKLLSALYNGIGFGKRVQSIENARNRIENEYQNRRDSIQQDINQLEGKIDNVNQAVNRANDMTVSGIHEAKNTINQYINGGSTPGGN